MRVRTPRLTIGQQMAAMRRHFPYFTYRREKNVPTWCGTLQPTETSPAYVVKVSYRQPKTPKANVLSPPLQADTPHRYPDGSLCLYYPRDRSWSPARLIAETIVPWTALWLRFYELWLGTGQWYGPEAPHSKTKHG